MYLCVGGHVFMCWVSCIYELGVMYLCVGVMYLCVGGHVFMCWGSCIYVLGGHVFMCWGSCICVLGELILPLFL